jgi:hypothetical protein
MSAIASPSTASRINAGAVAASCALRRDRVPVLVGSVPLSQRR